MGSSESLVSHPGRLFLNLKHFAFVTVRLLAATSCLALLPPSAQSQERARPEPPASTKHDFVLHNFKTESGTVVPELHVIYGTYGSLDAAKDNVVLLPSHYMAKYRGYEWLIGAPPARSLDPSKLFLVSTELFGNGSSSSPSNTPEPFHGPRFPVMTIRDNVQAVHQLLTQELGVHHLRAVVGFSMGAEQAFQWAVSYPDFMDRIVATSGTARCWPHGIVRNEGQIAAITADENFKGGDYISEPAQGISAFGMVWAGWLYSQEWWRDELWKAEDPKATLDSTIAEFRDHFIEGADANNLILQMRTWEKHDVGTTPGFNGDTKKALASIKVPVLYMPSATDMYFPVGDARYESQFIPNVTLKPIPSLYGHPAGAGASPADLKFLNDNIGDFLSGKPVQGEAVRKP